MSQPPVVTSFSHISDVVRNLLGDDLALDSEKATVSVPVDKLQALSEKVRIPYRILLLDTATDIV